VLFYSFAQLMMHTPAFVFLNLSIPHILKFSPHRNIFNCLENEVSYTNYRNI